MIERELEQFLGRLEQALSTVGRRERQRALREARDHVLCAVAEGRSARSAIEAFGAVESIAAGYARPSRSGGGLARAGALATVAVACAFAFAPTGSRLGEILIPTSHAADMQCAGRWNADPVATGFRLAWVSSPGPSCEVVLHGARLARVFRQDTLAGRWRAIVASDGASWRISRLSSSAREHAYAVGSDGRIGRRLGSG